MWWYVGIWKKYLAMKDNSRNFKKGLSWGTISFKILTCFGCLNIHRYKLSNVQFCRARNKIGNWSRNAWNVKFRQLKEASGNIAMPWIKSYRSSPIRARCPPCLVLIIHIWIMDKFQQHPSACTRPYTVLKDRLTISV